MFVKSRRTRNPSRRSLLTSWIGDRLSAARILGAAWIRRPTSAGNQSLADEYLWPRVRRLEPRYVLSATAELNALGQLFVMGTSSSETVQLGIDPGGELLLRNEADVVIPIAGHPDGPGMETNPLAPEAINSGQILFDLGGSPDLLNLELPSGLDVFVNDGGGEDITQLRLRDDQTPGTVDVESETIEILPVTGVTVAGGANLILAGNVTYGQTDQFSELNLGDGSISVDGMFIVRGDTTIVGDGAAIDLESAVLSTDSAGTTLSIDLQAADDGDLRLGRVDQSAGHYLKAIDIRSAASVSVADQGVLIAGDFSAVNVDSIQIDGDIDTTADQQDGDIFLQSNAELALTSDATLSVGAGSIGIIGGGGTVNLGGGTLISEHPNDAISIVDAEDIRLGEIQAESGLLRIGANRDISGDIEQAPETALSIDRLAVSSSGSLLLTSDQNQIRLIERIEIDGDITVNHEGEVLTIVEIDSNGNDVNVTSQQAIFVSQISAANANVQLSALSINDAMDDFDPDIIGRNVTLIASFGIGNLQPLELFEVAELTAISFQENVVLSQLSDQPMRLETVFAGQGAISISSLGSIEAVQVISENRDNMGGDARDIQLAVAGATSDLVISTVAAFGDADVLLFAEDDIIDSDLTDRLLIFADDLELIAFNGTPDSDASIDLSTDVNQLQATVLGPNRGDLKVRQVDAITLAASDAGGDEIIQTSNGQIVIAAGGEIAIVDTSPGDDGADRKLDPELVAGGEFGRIDLESTDRIRLQDDVQLHAEKITRAFTQPETMNDPSLEEPTRSDRAVYLQSESIEFGERIEINTGQGQGVARIFAPRPVVEIDRSDPDHPKPAIPKDPNEMPAFFDPFTVDTNILEQALVNDATGILTLDIGRAGERGLAVDIDWGAPGSEAEGIGQFQRISGLSADDGVFVGVGSEGAPTEPVVVDDDGGLLRVEHFYTQEVILDSRENGRPSATDPLEVRFSVRHHESIFVQADQVIQSPGTEPSSVAGQVVTSTDDPRTKPGAPNGLENGGLENGQASFVIPPLSIPTAFFPVRDVIPELDTPEFVVDYETSTPLSQGSVSVVEASASSTIGRDEFFQIRVLSPDPDGEDLAPPQRLPDDILSGDKIQKLFQQLPDGEYEIEYVVGDGNERSILRVDIRDGEARIPREPLGSEGELRLLPEMGKDDSSSGDESVEPESRPQGNRDAADQEPRQRDGDEPNDANTDDNESAQQGNTLLVPSTAMTALMITPRKRFRRRQRRLSAAARFRARRIQVESK